MPSTRSWFPFALVLLAGGAAGCSHYFGSRWKNESVPYDPARQPAAATVLLLDSPREVREDYSYPPGKTQQGFFWGDEHEEWRIQFPAQGYAHAGFRFFRSKNLQARRDDYELILTIQPGSMARYLWAGLVDGEDAMPNVLIDRPLASYLKPGRLSDRVTVRIPLRDFADRGIAVVHDQPLDGTTQHPFDWNDVREVRLTHNGGRLPHREVVITKLRFER